MPRNDIPPQGPTGVVSEVLPGELHAATPKVRGMLEANFEPHNVGEDFKTP